MAKQDDYDDEAAVTSTPHFKAVNAMFQQFKLAIICTQWPGARSRVTTTVGDLTYTFEPAVVRVTNRSTRADRSLWNWIAAEFKKDGYEMVFDDAANAVSLWPSGAAARVGDIMEPVAPGDKRRRKHAAEPRAKKRVQYETKHVLITDGGDTEEDE
jgi:hypothetical protein